MTLATFMRLLLQLRAALGRHLSKSYGIARAAVYVLDRSWPRSGNAAPAAADESAATRPEDSPGRNPARRGRDRAQTTRTRTSSRMAKAANDPATGKVASI